MLKHEHFEELCAAASIGQATGEELLELEQHVAECDACHQAYFVYLKVAANEFVAAKQDPTLSPQDAQECLNSELFTRRFFDRAEREGIVFSPEVDQNIKLPAPISFAFSRQPSWQTTAMAMAAALLLFMVVVDRLLALERFMQSQPDCAWNHNVTMRPKYRDSGRDRRSACR